MRTAARVAILAATLALALLAWALLRPAAGKGPGPLVTVRAADASALSADTVAALTDMLRPALLRWREAGVSPRFRVALDVVSVDGELRVVARSGHDSSSVTVAEDEFYGRPGPAFVALVPGLVESLLADLARRPVRSFLAAGRLGLAGVPVPALAWRRVPGGEFRVGGDRTRWGPSERRRVKTLEMSRAEVSFREYGACVDAGACPEPHVSDGTCHVPGAADWGPGRLGAGFQGPDQPVVCVTMAQARRFATWVGARLPDELEWEYAARGGGEETRFPWGEDLPTCARAVIAEGGWGCGRGTPWPGCSKPDGNTRSGLCDMIGNVWEWVEDPPPGRQDGGPRYLQHDRPVPAWHVVGRGGAFNRAPDSIDVETRDLDLGTRAANIGFRIVRDVP